MFSLIRRHPYASGGIAVAFVAFAAWLAFGFFGIHTAFIDDVVDDEGPVFASGAGAEVATTSPETTITVETTEAGATPTTGTATTDGSEGATETTEAPATTAAPETTAPAEPQIVTLVEGQFSGTGRYDVSGNALVLNDGTEQRFLRFEDFESDNGPDLDVYLSAAPPGASSGELTDDWILLSELRGNIGDQNYELDPSIDLERYSTVVVWCTRFNAEFGRAELA
ncbi:MAG: DM13 domain-containing protein [Actinomycetota bacterium]